MDELRRKYIKRRRSLSPEENRRLSEAACRRLMETEAYKKAKTIMIYRAMRGELSMAFLEEQAKEDGKLLLYPLCIENSQMLALRPFSEDSFRKGSFGIGEPDPERSQIVDPKDIDLVVCPCTAFDEDHYRLGMGGGYYDRFLPKCTKAVKCSIAFEIQKGDDIPHESWDQPVDFCVTDRAIYA